MEYSVSCAPLIAKNFIKYERLSSMTNTAFAGSKETSMSIFIDLNSILLPLYSNQYDPTKDQSDFEIASVILNMIAHYRSFYWRFYKVETNFYLIYSTNCGAANKMYYPEYNCKNAAKMVSKSFIHKRIVDNLIVIEKICSYLNNVCYFSSSYDTSAMIAYIIENDSKDFVNIILTKDMATTQLVSYCKYYKKFIVAFRPKKYRGEDMSFFITPTNLYAYLFNEYKVQWDQTKVTDPSLYTFILAASKCPERSYKSVMSLSAIMSEVSLTASYGSYIADANMIIHSLSEKTSMNLLRANVEGRYKALDAIYQAGLLKNSPERINYKGMVNLYDPNGLHAIAEEYFKKTPLNFENM